MKLNDEQKQEALRLYLLDGATSDKIAEALKVEEPYVSYALAQTGIDVSSDGLCHLAKKAKSLGHSSIGALFSSNWSSSLAQLSKRLRAKRFTKSMLAKYYDLVLGVTQAKEKQHGRG